MMAGLVLLFFKGAAMGAANVIPGVSGGTIAFITGIYERLITAIKHIDLHTARLVFSGRWKEAARRLDFTFLFVVMLGVVASIFSLAKVLEYLFAEAEVLTMAFFFGLILTSVWLVSKEVRKWTVPPVLSFIFGAGVAVALAILEPAQPNDSMLYLFLCGMVAVVSMILPGLSGAYVLLIMGNYILVLKGASDMDFRILLPVMAGAAIGLLAFSHLISAIFARAHDIAVGLLGGFVLGSLLIIWPWKIPETILHEGESLIIGYSWEWPVLDGQFALALGCCLVGAVMVMAMARMDRLKTKHN